VASGVPPSLWRSYRPHFLPESTAFSKKNKLFFVFFEKPPKTGGFREKIILGGSCERFECHDSRTQTGRIYFLFVFRTAR
ncbi:hypothetical protein, partial [uncultured Bartonella sp.]|uniref:hypothetical protein n=1 Tax=uncultured Bartonella sp. TaxID=104108 RepID=UPI0025E9A3E5